MSRLKRFAHSLFSGYVLLGANMAYTFASIPLALHYLSRPEFGLWALTMQISGYITLIDAGMSASVSRILVDHKDSRADGTYGSIIKTGGLVGVAQGALIFPIGLVLACFAGPLFHIPTDSRTEFAWLLIVQSALLSVQFAARIFSHVLVAHQRWEISNYTQSVLFGVSLGAMWISLEAGCGTNSFLISQAVIASGAVVNLIGCIRLGLLPGEGEWGNASWARFKELFGFGKDVFLYSVGTQFINASQTILLTRFFGLDLAAVWSVCTRTYVTLGMLLWRILEYANPVVAEMMVRSEKERLLKRFRELVVVSGSLSILAACVFGMCNTAFVQVWTHGKVSWPASNDWLLAIWLIISTVMRTHVMLAGATKRFGFLRYAFLLEGLLFVGFNILMLRWGGITLMLVSSIVCTLLFTLPYGLYRTRNYFGLSWKEMLQWHYPPIRLAICLIPLALLIWFLTKELDAPVRLLINCLVAGFAGTALLLRLGLNRPILHELWKRTPPKLRKHLEFVTGQDGLSLG